MEDKAASDTVDLVSESRMPETSMDQCCVCPFCPRACDVVFKTRKMLLDHVRHGGSSHGQVSVPQDADLEWVQAEKVIHCGRYRWVRTVSSSSHQIAVTSFAMDDFRYQSKFEERLHLLTKYAQFVEGGPEFERQHPGFEKRKIGKDLQFYQDALLFVQRIAIATNQARYRLRQFAKRDEKGQLKISGFNCLFCKASMKTYARTLARFIFYAINSDEHGDQFQAACKSLRGHVAEKSHCQSELRIEAVDAFFHASMTQPQSISGFSISTFVELFYAVAPQGFMNRSADFVRHAAVHLIYGMRGGYILTCQKAFDPERDVSLSFSFLNEQNESAYASLQSIKRIAAVCLEALDCRIQWTLTDDAEVITCRGDVVVSQASMSKMYTKLLHRCNGILDLIGFPILSNELILKCRDPSSKKPGEGIMSMNVSVYQLYCDQNPQVLAFQIPQASVKAKKNLCSQIYSIGKALLKALYFAGGPSARLTEISSWIVSNTNVNHERNVRFLRGHIAAVNTYSKQGGAGIPQGQQMVVCFADKLLTSLVLTYLIVLKNLESRLVTAIPEFGLEASKNSQVCFLIDKGKPVDGTRLGKIYREEFLSNELDVTVSDMRHVLEAYARREGCWLEESLPFNPLLVMANHAPGSSNSTYGKGVNHDLPEVDADRMEQCWKCSQWWNSHVLGSDDLKSSVGMAISAVKVVDSSIKRINPDKIHEFSEQDICRSQSQTQKGVQISVIPDLKRQCIQSGTVVRPILREKQEEMMNHLNSNTDHHSLYILPTGSGKTKVVILDSLARRKCNLIFVPLVAIKQELMKAQEDHSELKVFEWSDIRQDFSAAALRANIVVASFEHACQGMISFIQRLDSCGRLGYCFVDEVEMILQGHRSFGLFWSLAATSPLVKFKAMTATLRPRDKVFCETKLGVKFNSELRFSCRRDDIKVSCRFIQNGQAVTAALEVFVAQILSEMSSRILIFCMGKEETDDIGEKLRKKHPGEVSICHSDRREVLNRVSVVTSCVQSGINEKGLTHVIVMISAWSVEGLLQVRFFMHRLQTFSKSTDKRNR
jgi:hypothetical protein